MNNKAWTVTLTPEAGDARTQTVSQDEMLALVVEAMHGRPMGDAVRAATQRAAAVAALAVAA